MSPDGLCVLTSTTSDARWRLYNTIVPDTSETPLETDETDTTTTTSPSSPIVKWEPALMAPAGDTVRSYCWYPQMNSQEPATCCFLATSRCVFKKKRLWKNAPINNFPLIVSFLFPLFFPIFFPETNPCIYGTLTRVRFGPRIVPTTRSMKWNRPQSWRFPPMVPPFTRAVFGRIVSCMYLISPYQEESPPSYVWARHDDPRMDKRALCRQWRPRTLVQQQQHLLETTISCVWEPIHLDPSISMTHDLAIYPRVPYWRE